MSVNNVNLLWKNFRGIRKLNTINSEQEFGADIAHGVRLTKEKSGQLRSIRSSGYFAPFCVVGTTTISQTTGSSLSDITVAQTKFATKSDVQGSGTYVFSFDGDKWVDADSEEVDLVAYGITYSGTPVSGDELTVTYDYENVIRLFVANFSGYGADTLVAFTKDDVNSKINVWIVYDSTFNSTQTKIAEFPFGVGGQDVTDVCMTQWGDRLGMVVAFGSDYLGFVFYSADANIPDTTPMGSTGFLYRSINLQSNIEGSYKIHNVTSVCPYRSRLAINGETNYVNNNNEAIYGIWFSEAGNLLNFNANPITSASETSAFYVETGERVNKLVEYHGLTAFCGNRSYNVTGTSQEDIAVKTLVSRGVFGNAAFVMNGQCSYIDSYAKNVFTLRDNIDGTIGFDNPVGDDIQDYLNNVENVTINALNRRVRLLKQDGQSLVYDVDVQEWIDEIYPEQSRAVTFLNAEYFCCGGQYVYQMLEKWQYGAINLPDSDGYYSHYRTNLMWLDSQSSVKSHLYPFAVILEPQTNNNFFIKFTTDRGNVLQGHVTKGTFENIATYVNNDDNLDGGFFVSDDDDISGKVFFGVTDTELLVTIDRPPFWRYLQIDIYTTTPEQQFAISGIEAKNTVISDEMLEY